MELYENLSQRVLRATRLPPAPPHLPCSAGRGALRVGFTARVAAIVATRSGRCARARL